VRGVHDSRKKNDGMSITMISRSDKVIRINRDPVTLTVSYQFLMQLSLDEGDVATDVYVLDGMVAVRVNNDGFKFFIEPLVSTTAVTPLQ